MVTIFIGEMVFRIQIYVTTCHLPKLKTGAVYACQLYFIKTVKIVEIKFTLIKIPEVLKKKCALYYCNRNQNSCSF